MDSKQANAGIVVEPAHGVTFLVGAPRSGTTWLQLLLAQSEQVATCNETHLFSAYLRPLLDRSIDNAREVGLQHLFSEKEYLEFIAHIVEPVFAKIRSKKPAAQIVLEKTPGHALYGEHILKVFPRAKFIHIVRDPRAVVASLASAGQSWGRGWASSGIVHNAGLWLTHVSAGRAIHERTDSYIEVRYEDLCRDTPAELSKLFDWLCVPTSPNECLRYTEACAFGELKTGRSTGNFAWDIGKEPASFFNSGTPDSWRMRLSRRDIAVVEYITGHIMQDLGYDQETHSLSYPVRPFAQKLLVRIGGRIRALGMGL